MSDILECITCGDKCTSISLEGTPEDRICCNCGAISSFVACALCWDERVSDKFISFKESTHDEPYRSLAVLKIEDIFGFMMTYRKPYNDDSRKSLKNYRNRLTKYCRGTCTRFPLGCTKHREFVRTTVYDGAPEEFRTKVRRIKRQTDTCRVLYLKEAMVREIKGLTLSIQGNMYRQNLLVKDA